MSHMIWVISYDSYRLEKTLCHPLDQLMFRILISLGSGTYGPLGLHWTPQTTRSDLVQESGPDPIRSFSGTGAGRYGQLGLSTDKFWSVDPWLKQIQKWLIIIQWTADGYILNFRHGPIWTVDQDFIVGGRDFCPDRPPHGRIQTTNGHIDQSHGRKWRPDSNRPTRQ